MASLDFSDAIVVMKLELMLKGISIVGLLPDLVKLVTKWLTSSYLSVSADDSNS